MICFDQSFDRNRGVSKEKQREVKRAFLRERGILSFYYVSHAPFPFSRFKEKGSCWGSKALG